MSLHKVLQVRCKFIPQLQRAGAGRNPHLLIKLQAINYHLHDNYKGMENIISLT